MKKVLLLTIVILLTSYGPAAAEPFTPTFAADTYGIAQGGVNNGIPTPSELSSSSLNLYNTMNLLLGTSYTHNTDIDSLYFGADPIWTRLNDSDALVILIGGDAARSNMLNVYDINIPAVKVPVISFGPIIGYTGDGLTSSTAFVARQNNLSPGTLFGWSLLTSGEGVDNNWDSDPTKNLNGLDHLLVYQLPNLAGQTRYIDLNGVITEYEFKNPFLLTWEDKRLNNGVLGDEDYNDLTYLVTRAAPVNSVVPEPMTLSLLGSGFIGMLAMRRKRKA